MSATFSKLQSGEWGIRVEHKVSVGDVVVTTTRAGVASTMIVDRIVWTNNAVWLCEAHKSVMPTTLAIGLIGAQAQANVPTPPSVAHTGEHIGAEGAKVTATVRLVSRRDLDGSYGTTYLYKFVDKNGNNINWFSSRSVLDVTHTNRDLILTGTVKKCDEYRGVKQTTLTRCKVVYAEIADVA